MGKGIKYPNYWGVTQLLWQTQVGSTNYRSWREFCWKKLVHFFGLLLFNSYTKIHTNGMRSPMLETWVMETWADRSDIFWSCPAIRSYWQAVEKAFNYILGIGIEQSYLVLYLENIPLNLASRDRYLLKIILAASKKAVTSKWLVKDYFKLWMRYTECKTWHSI